MASRIFAPFGRRIIPRLDLSQSPRRTAASATSNASKQMSQLQRVNARLPRFLQRFTSPLMSAPITHISAFLILHEITAVVPLFGLAGLFHYTNWLPPFVSEWSWFSDGMRMFGNYFRKKGWFRELEEADEAKKTWGQRVGRWWTHGEKGSQVLVEFAAAWAITKLLLPVRLIVSVWATPLFARIFVAPPLRAIGRMFRQKPAAAGGAGSKLSPAAGTNAVGGGAIRISTKL